MALLRELAKKYRVVSVVGMAKNAGKTTALNYLIAEAADGSPRLGITSTGRDGESVDVVTRTAKPKIFLEDGTLVTVPTGLYGLAEAGLEILRMTECFTALGQILLCRVADSGNVQVAGPVRVEDQIRLNAEMLRTGAEMILIDGAVDRRSIASPEASDAIILSTGAALSRSIAAVAAETGYLAELYGLPELEDAWVRTEIEKNAGAERILTFGEGRVRAPDVKTGLAAGRFIGEELRPGTDYLYLPGALTKGMLSDLPPKALQNTAFVVADPTKIFLDRNTWRRLRGKGLRVFLRNSVKIAAVTVNPCSPEGYAFDSEALAGAVREAVGGGIPVIDVMRGG
ncbi:MAG: hypothetical protein LBT26_09365 [Clostridiales Family XIII bacterium]|jgi:hypothetical protein|nr:hypothetical protein [Clostridiales Family XIII bacterium]